MDQPPNKHTVFVDSEKEAEVGRQGVWSLEAAVWLSVWSFLRPPLRTPTKPTQAFDPVAHFETVPELAARAFNRPRKETLEVCLSKTTKRGGSCLV